MEVPPKESGILGIQEEKVNTRESEVENIENVDILQEPGEEKNRTEIAETFDPLLPTLIMDPVSPEKEFKAPKEKKTEENKDIYKTSGRSSSRSKDSSFWSSRKKSVKRKGNSVEEIMNRDLYSVESSSSEEEEKSEELGNGVKTLHTIDTDELNRNYAGALSILKKGNYSNKKRREKEEEVKIQENIREEFSKHKVDPECEIGNVEVYQDYSAMLNLTDVAYGIHGHNKFYLIQLLTSTTQTKYYIFFKWGRVGAEHPQTKLIPFYSKIDAILMFEKKFRDKTTNYWSNRNTFRHVEGKYLLIHAEGKGKQGKDELRKEKIARDLFQKSMAFESLLEVKVMKLMHLISDVTRLRNTMKQLNFDLDRFPLGKLSKSQIQKGFTILQKIQEALMKGTRYIYTYNIYIYIIYIEEKQL